ncbi:MAG TPA: hypothetical protein VNS32_20500 [Flavisolibacter sp.]|nr:hypothetical protein [Flavisolibacter sp.]
MKNLYLIATAILLTCTVTYLKHSGSALFLGMAESNPSPVPTIIDRVDTIAINVKANPTGYITDTITSHWNNRIAGLSGKTTFGKLVWKSDGSMSSTVVSFFQGSSFTSANPCTSSSIAPTIVLKYGSIAAGTKDPSIGDAVYGGRNINISGLDTSYIYDIVLLASKSDLDASMTLSCQNQSSSAPVMSNCSNYPKLNSLVPDASGSLTINLHGPTAISNTIINGLYIIKHEISETGPSESIVQPLPATTEQSAVTGPSFVERAGWWKPKPLQKAYVYTPAGYNDAGNTQKYPMIIYLHDADQRGSVISKLLETGLPKEISEGQKMNCVVFCPQIDSLMPSWYSYYTKYG